MLPQVAGLVVNPSRCTQHWPVHATTLACHQRLGHCTTLRVIWQLQSVSGRTTSSCWSVRGCPSVFGHLCEICYHGTPWQRRPLPALWCKAARAPLGERLSFNLNDCSLVSAQQHARPCRDNKRDSRQMLTAALVPSEDGLDASFRLRHVWLVCPHTAVSRRRRFTGAVFIRFALDFDQGGSFAALSGSSGETCQLPATY